MAEHFAWRLPLPQSYCHRVPITIAQLNTMPQPDFVRTVGPVFEHSPWIAERASERRPFESADDLRAALCDTVDAAGEAEKLALIRAHPDLVGRAVLTAESQGEQAAAGLLELTPEESGLFAQYNREYRERFDFPFVICARLNKKEAILDAFPRRLKNSRAEEIQTALEEIFKIAQLRLADLINDE